MLIEPKSNPNFGAPPIDIAILARPEGRALLQRISLIALRQCQHRDKLEPKSLASGEPGFEGLIGGDAQRTLNQTLQILGQWITFKQLQPVSTQHEDTGQVLSLLGESSRGSQCIGPRRV